MKFDIIIPYYNGTKTILNLVKSIPKNIRVFLVDDFSTEKIPELGNVTIIKDTKKGYFAGAVNFGINSTSGDVLILNQDVYFTNDEWIKQLEDATNEGYSFIGERIRGEREDWPNGYIHGTFMYMSRNMIDTVGLLNADLYPMWGNTAEYQLRAARAGFKVLPIVDVKGFVHLRPKGDSFGSSFKTLLKTESNRKMEFVLTPPLVSVIIPVHGEKYAKFLPSTVNSLIGGATDLGEWKQQTFASFEVVIVEDSSTDNTGKIVDDLCDVWKGVRSIHLKRPYSEVISEVNGKYIGKVVSLNAGIKAAYGKYIVILDADDMMKEDRIERMFNALRNNPHHFIYDNWQFFRNGQILEVEFPPRFYGYDDLTGEYGWQTHPNAGKRTSKPTLQDYDFEVTLHKNQVHNSIMFEKSAWVEVGGYPERFKYGREDWAMNVRLGIHGYCGFRLKDYHGLLYRRDGENRTLENSKPKWMEYFQAKMRQEYRQIYEGVRPMACCGKGSKTGVVTRTDAFAKTALTIDIAKEGTTLLIYTGPRTVNFPVYGFFTNTLYRVYPGKPFAADNRDLKSTSSNHEGLLERTNPGGSFMFDLYTVPETNTVPETKVAPQVLEVLEVPQVLEATKEVPVVDFSILDGNLSALTLALSENDYTKEELMALLAYELENKNRITAKELLEGLINA